MESNIEDQTVHESDSQASDEDTPLHEDGADHAEDLPSTPWQPQNVQSTCEFVHVIQDYANKRESGCKKAEYSDITVDEFGNRWRLIVYVNGNGRASNHHLSLFLQVADADDLPFGWKKSVSYVLTLEHPDGGQLSYAKRNPDKMFKLCPKAIDWGWSQFITSDRIQQEGFVANDSLIVRASVTVKASSVSIDKEDAELYLKCAVEEGDPDAVELCLEQGATVNCQFKDDLYTPLHTACSSNNGSKSLDVLNLLLERGADGNACNKWKETPLLIAANNGFRAAVEALLKYSADPSLCSEAGWSALTFAAHKGYEDIVALLLLAGAPVNCRVTEDASTPLHKACAGSKAGHLASVKLLIEGGADVHSLNKWRETPLLTAANHGQAGAVEALLRAGADPCKCTDTGWSPLSIAAYKGHDDVVRLLLEEGAPTEEEDPTLSALLQAATKGLPSTVELLLQHGADHTVTTKKGDTALSILVEQNLIDTAVDMVTEYNASISRCSRDRKKIQRARLLINLRMKQVEKESQNSDSRTDDDGSDDGKEVKNDDQTEASAMKGRKKERSSTVSAEEKAKAAEEALLQELEEEENKAKKEEAEASNKRAKKKKKKERERQQKQKEEQERRDREKQEAKERDRERKEKEEIERKEREERLKEQEKQIKETAERERAIESKRREKERKDKTKEDRNVASAPETPKPSSESQSKHLKSQANGSGSTSTSAKPLQIQNGSPPAVNEKLTGSRRWETNGQSPQSGKPKEATTPVVPTSNHSLSPEQFPNHRSSVSQHETFGMPSTTKLQQKPAVLINEKEAGFLPRGKHAHAPNRNAGLQDKWTKQQSVTEHPAIAIFRRDKIVELLNQCKIIPVVDEITVKRVIHRWIVRASHSRTPFLDALIPSWVEQDQLIAFFQRQLISESRRGHKGSVSVDIEVLKEVGASLAVLCHNVANEVANFRRTVEGQLPDTWTDTDIGMAMNPGSMISESNIVFLSWSGRAKIEIPSQTLARLQARYVGPQGRFLSSVFGANIWYDTFFLISQGTLLELQPVREFKEALISDVAISVELWTDLFSVTGDNKYLGKFDTIDSLFGGQIPFGKDDKAGGDSLINFEGSAVVLPPSDSMLASRYIQRILDIIDRANASNAAVSFAVLLHAECFQDRPNGPSSAKDLILIDPRLGIDTVGCISHLRILSGGQHRYIITKDSEEIISSSNSMFVMFQSEMGKSRFGLSETSLSRIIASMSVKLQYRNGPQIGMPLTYPGSLTSSSTPFEANDTFLDPIVSKGLPPLSPDPQNSVHSDFGTIGGGIGQPFTPSSVAASRRRGRLFDLVDDIEEDTNLNDDIVSGMLNNLDVGLFQNPGIGAEVDIEAISLMGIGSGTQQSMQGRMPNSRGRFD